MNSEIDPKQRSNWSRLVPMIILALCFGLAHSVLFLVALIQFIWTAVDNAPNPELTSFGASLSKWLAQTAAYLSYASEIRPFPWDAWPKDHD